MRWTLGSLFKSAPLMCLLASAHMAQADTIFNVSGTFDDNSSTPLAGTVTVDTATGAVDGFYFDIPTMTTGTTTLAGALFTPATATVGFSDVGTVASFVNFQLFGASPNSEELYLLIPPVTLPYSGSTLLQEVTFGGEVYHTGYQSGAQSNPFFELTGDGSITPAATPEPSSYLLLGSGIAAVVLKRGKTRQS